MNTYLQNTFHQIQITINSIKALIEIIDESDFQIAPIEGKRTVGELVSHVAIICKADLQIIGQASMEKMDAFYELNAVNSKKEMLKQLNEGYEELVCYYESLPDIFNNATSYWGTTYSHFEWLLEILAHLNHHRAQLHLYITLLGKEPAVRLFE
ncbi:DinB family protein [Viridibacillus arvi]|uniref:DinB family protein n=1 Tax=Viridibacillus arvi TaxID=263475 RepID=UPI00187BB7D8|nr:DinB family protein [Viridibacillus sp. JNUCC-6]QOV12191.1 DinB family protein [Viridibacillus sp. JNUCC-6]